MAGGASTAPRSATTPAPAVTRSTTPPGYYVCPTVLWTRIQSATVRCRTCKATYDAHERRAWLLDSAQEVEETASVIASALSVMLRRRLTASTIRTWVQRNLLAAVGERGSAKLYRVRDVRAALERPMQSLNRSDAPRDQALLDVAGMVRHPKLQEWI
jgi:hypothetical protein